MANPKLYEEQFLSKHNFPHFDGKPKFLAIASSPRSGSHMLGHILYDTKMFGYPLEYLQSNNLKKWEEILQTKGSKNVLSRLQSCRTSPNGIFGLKIHYSDVSSLGGIKTLDRLLPGASYVIIWRRDVLAQAISFAKAIQTGVWINNQTPVGEPQYDYKLIHNCLKNILKQTAEWHYQLAMLGSPTIDIVFEDLVADTPRTIHKIFDFMNLDREKIHLDYKPSTVSQKNSINQLWSKRFREDSNFSSIFFDINKGSSGSKSIVINQLSRYLLRIKQISKIGNN